METLAVMVSEVWMCLCIISNIVLAMVQHVICDFNVADFECFSRVFLFS